MSTTALASQAQHAYQALRAAIEAGELRAGERVTERSAAARCGVSPTPARDALRRLEREGLVTRLGPRTLVVAEISPTTQRQMGEVEVTLRGLVARFAATNVRDAEVVELRSTLDRADDLVVAIEHGGRTPRRVQALLETLAEFNRGVERACHLPALVDALQQARVLSPIERAPRLLERAVVDDSFGAARYRDHRRLLDAIADRDPDGAHEVAIAHAQAALADLL
ncbi:GntR family transcriptional regulator [Patulibacter americanus]|uniref:GntR family transcriptional regulator n=1 Tax=Patulibacter americanus TaxID=588672 RepID=UPI0003B6C437|nr:GntR family transcriptional regulator [Patulibacter americanus]